MGSDVNLGTLLRDIEIRLHPGTSDDQECEGEKTYGGRHRIGRVLRSYSVAIRELPPIVNIVLPLELGDGGLDRVQIGEVNFDPVEPRKKIAGVKMGAGHRLASNVFFNVTNMPRKSEWRIISIGLFGLPFLELKWERLWVLKV